MNPEEKDREQLLEELYTLRKDRDANRKLKEKYADLLQKYMNVISYLPVGIYRTDTTGKVIEGNDAFGNILGFNNLLDLNDVNMKDHFLNPRKYDELQRRLLTESFLIEEYEMIRKDRKRIWVMDYSHANLSDDGDQILFISGVLIDITDRKNIERELRRSGLVLEGVSFAAEQLLKDSKLEANIPEMLDSISFAIGASRGYVCCLDKEFDGFTLQKDCIFWKDILQTEELPDPSADLLPLYGTQGADWYSRLQIGETISGTIDDFSEAEAGILKNSNIQSLLIVPVFLEGKIWGLMGFEDCFKKRKWEAAELFAMRTAANILGAALERNQMMNRLRKMSVTDEMTGLTNRRGFMVLASQQIKMALRKKNKLVFIFIDMDGLKWINDNLGHKDGDLAICDMSEALQVTFRDSDIVARIGGDEFVGIAVDSVEEGGQTIRDRLKQVMKEFNLKNARKYVLSASVGVTIFSPDEPCTLDELLTKADDLMYEEKKNRKAKRGEKIEL